MPTLLFPTLIFKKTEIYKSIRFLHYSKLTKSNFGVGVGLSHQSDLMTKIKNSSFVTNKRKKRKSN